MKLPILSPRKPFVSQTYGNTSNNAWYLANGITAPFHQGVDFVCGSNVQTYGTPLVCPFDSAKVVKLTWDNSMSTKGNGVTIEAKILDITFQLVLWHTGEINVKIGQILKEKDIICYIGNSGLCSPKPTPENPYGGSHLHLMLYMKGKLIDPMIFFNKDEWYLGVDSGMEHDIEPLKWRWKNLGTVDWWMKLLDAVSF
jgi:murein DD-endopeptidase MepM/ murein hydrolase activator NlpD